MSIEQKAAKVFKMSDEVWERHANPWSVWTRFPCLPLISLAIWSRVWLGWMCWIPIGLIVFWIWINPRVFGRPESTKNWASKAVLGERVMLRHSVDKIPSYHLKMIKVLKVVMLVGFIQVVYGLTVLHLGWTVMGTVILILGKMWFLDRMVWLYQDLSADHKEYQGWLY